jgi:hypothetical protein
MRILIGIAAVAVIAAVGLYFYRDYQAQERAELVGQYQSCRARLSDIAQARMSADDTGKVTSCLVQGFVTDDDVKRAYEKARKAAGLN